MVELKVCGVKIQFSEREAKTITRIEPGPDFESIRMVFIGGDVRHFSRKTGKRLFPDGD